MGRILLDKEFCKGCYICVSACPKGLIQKSEEPNEHGEYPAEFVDKENACIGCAICAMNCPDAAIKEVYK